MTIESLDNLIRSNAERALQGELYTVFMNLYAYIGTERDSMFIKVSALPKPDGDGDILVKYLLDAIREHIYDNLRPKRGNDAVRDFLKRVETLESELSDLRDHAPADERDQT